MWENMNVTNVARLGVDSKSAKPSRTTRETARSRFSSSQQSLHLVVCSVSLLDMWFVVVMGGNMHVSNVDQVVSKCWNKPNVVASTCLT